MKSSDYELSKAGEELRLVQAAQAGKSAEKEQLLQMHAPFVRLLAARMQTPKCMKEELFQAGMIGLLRAINSFDCTRNARLLSYAASWIIGEMKAALHALFSEHWTLCSLDEQTENKQTLEERLGQEDAGYSYLDLRIAMTRLTEEEKTLIYLRYFRDWTQKQTAIHLSLSQAQVSKLEKKALDRLRILLT